MCFYTTVESSPLLAHRDMVCYKILDRNMCSWIKGFKYTMNKVYKTELGILEEGLNDIYFTSLGKRIISKHTYCIFSGFHSYQRNTKQLSRVYRIGCLKISYIYKCIIPKGSLYYRNQFGEYVSDQIMIKEKVNFK